eukprot:266293-Hanusia_phi.AAC.2
MAIGHRGHQPPLRAWEKPRTLEPSRVNSDASEECNATSHFSSLSERVLLSPDYLPRTRRDLLT